MTDQPEETTPIPHNAPRPDETAATPAASATPAGESAPSGENPASATEAVGAAAAEVPPTPAASPFQNAFGRPMTPSAASTQPAAGGARPQDPQIPQYATPSTQSTQPTQPLPPQFGTPEGSPPNFAHTPSSAAPGPAKPRRGGVALAAALAIGAIIGGAAGGGVAFGIMAGQDSSAGENSSSSAVAPLIVNDTENVSAVTAVAAEAAPSVVTISVSGGSNGGSGSGVILSDDGYVLTNTHVVTLDGATADPTLTVTTFDGALYQATLVATDPISDLAVIKLTGASGLSPITFADSSDLNVGDLTVAIGSPLGLNGTVTDGIISALNRSITVASSAVPDTTTPDTEPDPESPYDDFWNFDIPGQEPSTTPPAATGSIALSVIQTDAAINPGNSGGALLNDDGELIGINVAIASASGTSSTGGNIGVGFAIPSNLAQRVANELISTGKASHGLLGATVGASTSDPTATVAGALINEVTPDGAAAAAGLQPGDIITRFNGVLITSPVDLTAQVRQLPGGSDAELSYVRDGQTKTAKVTLGTLG